MKRQDLFALAKREPGGMGRGDNIWVNAANLRFRVQIPSGCLADFHRKCKQEQNTLVLLWRFFFQLHRN